MEEALYLVAYPDGGCRGAEASAGGGLHGYFFKLTGDETPVQENSAPKKDTPTSRGYVDDNNFGELASLKALAVKPIEYVDYHHGLPYSTNNIGELDGAIKAFEVALEKGVKHLVLIPDSEYVINGIKSHLASWKASNWIKSDGQPVKNQQHWKVLDGLLLEAYQKGMTYDVQWVNSHTDNLGNDAADEQATRGVVLASKGLDEVWLKYSPAAGYYNFKANYNRMFFQPQWYFSTRVSKPLTEDGRSVYYTGYHDKDYEFHMKTKADATLTVLYLEKPEPVLDELANYQESLETENYGTSVIGYLDAIFNSRNYSELEKFGSKYVRPHPKKNLLLLVDDTLLTRPMRPAYLSWKATEVVDNLRIWLDAFELWQRTGSAGQLGNISVTDITAELYELDSSKKKPVCKLHSNVTPSTKLLDLPVNYCVDTTPGSTNVRLTFGLDLPTRNSLSSIASLSPSVYVVSWKESAHGFRYATVVKAGGDISITAAIYSNLRALVPKEG